MGYSWDNDRMPTSKIVDKLQNGKEKPIYSWDKMSYGQYRMGNGNMSSATKKG